MIKADQYRHWAAECDLQAQMAANQTIRSQYQELARRWRVMAEAEDARSPPSTFQFTADSGPKIV